MIDVIKAASLAASPELAIVNRPQKTRVHRGPPKVFAASRMAEAAELSPGHSRRSLHDQCYATRADGMLREDTRFAWLYTADQSVRSVSLLAELGRFKDPAAIIEMAMWLCETKPTVRSGVARLRLRRLGKHAPRGNADELFNRFVNVINEYQIIRRKVDSYVLLKALRMASNAVGERDSRVRKQNAGIVAGKSQL